MAKKTKTKPDVATTNLPPQTLAENPNTALKHPNEMLAEQAAQGALSPEQIQQMQMEESLKESQDPSMRLKKLKHPISIKGCFRSIILLIILTLLVSFFIIYLYLDTFDLGVVIMDMLNEFGVIALLQQIGDWFMNLFTGGSILLA